MALTTPREGTRPTTDRTKEAIFSRLDAWGVLHDAHVLDLYAGTGALGFEALSRGASHVVEVEVSASAVALIARTCAVLRRHGNWDGSMSVRVVRGKAERFVRMYNAERGESPFDVVFIDPPYAVSTQDCEMLLHDMAAVGVVSAGGMVVLERSVRSEPPEPPQGWSVAERRDYGETTVWYLNVA